MASSLRLGAKYRTYGPHGGICNMTLVKTRQEYTRRAWPRKGRTWFYVGKITGPSWQSQIQKFKIRKLYSAPKFHGRDYLPDMALRVIS